MHTRQLIIPITKGEAYTKPYRRPKGTGRLIGIYEATRCYGGPEEGGWWYDWKEYNASKTCANHRHARYILRKIRAKYRTEDFIRLFIEGTPGINATQTAPHYE
jgi:hypothetical protein